MSTELLSQDEIDALLHGVDSGSVEAESDEPLRDGVARSFDFANQDRIVRGRLPTLEMINERFARYFRVSVFNFLRRAAEISVNGVQMMKFGEYIHSLFVPTSLTMVQIQPLRGTALVMTDPKLAFITVDNFFGGGGKYNAKIEGREFTATELRVVQLLLNHAFKDYQKAWEPVLDIKFKTLGHEVNPHLANIASPSEVVVISSFSVELEGGGGALHITLPYSMIEPIRQSLDAGIQSDRHAKDDRWNLALREEIMQSKVELRAHLADTQINLRQLAELKVGDVIPFDMPEQVIINIEELPILRGIYGQSRGSGAVKINSIVQLDTIANIPNEEFDS